MKRISPEEFKRLADHIHGISGIFLDPNKVYLVETRLSAILETHGFPDFATLQKRSEADATGSIRREIIDAITTNETLFFRDTKPFDLLRFKLLPELMDRKLRTKTGFMAPRIRIWSAGCSTGQEVYSIAMTLKETLGDTSGLDIQILGTDISDQAVARASQGVFTKAELDRGLSPVYLNKYFTPSGDRYKIRDEIRAMALFKKQNLTLPFTAMGKFDIVFCRNVAIYFTVENRRRMFERIAEVIADGGALIVGASESLTNVTRRFVAKPHLRTIYYEAAGAAGSERKEKAP